MALSDAQIDRFSRQIILPQVGGTGQERLLGSAVALAGAGELAAITTRYLVAAGVGRIALHGSHQLSGELNDLNPETHVTPVSGALGSIDADVLIACDCGLAEIDRAARSARPMAAGAIGDGGGWFFMAQPTTTCASCAARAALGVPGGGDARGRAPARRAETSPGAARPASLRSPAAGVVGSLMSIAVLKHLLGLQQPSAHEWLQFDPAGSTLTAHPIARAADCPACAVAAAP